ncbi:MAG: hypothetical protein QNK24_04740 [Desulfuromusa sp.]|nr:hypothetical protein [Desulfuromusa sp.]
MCSEISALTAFIKHNPELTLLISNTLKSDIDFWLVGGCLRNTLLDLPQVDIDIACSGDPTVLTQAWAAEVSGDWFWLDSNRRQSRVLLQDGLTVDFSPLRAPSIIEDLQLRDFTINALALPLDKSFPNSKLLDPLGGVNHLLKKQLHSCSAQSFTDDPLRMLKGIRHAVALDFELSAETLEQIISSAHLIVNVAGERSRDELAKILNAEKNIKGIELLIDTELLGVLFGSAGRYWDRLTAVVEIKSLNKKINEVGLTAEMGMSDSEKFDLFSVRAIFLLARLLKYYSPSNLQELLHKRLRLSRYQQRLLEELQNEPAAELFSLVGTLVGQRQQALLVEQLNPFAYEKMLYWGVYGNSLTLMRILELQKSFAAVQKLGRVPDLLNGRLISSLLKDSPNTQIGVWQLKLKLAEINEEISTPVQAENWLKSKLLFDNKEP